MSMISSEKEVASLLSRVMEDYRSSSEFFSRCELPEYKPIESLNLSDRELALFLTFGCVTNHIHNDTGNSKKTDGENGLWMVAERLWHNHPWVFYPEELVGKTQKDRLKTVLGNEDIMDSRDPEWWYTNAETLYEDYDSDPRQLLDDNDHIAPEIETTVEGYAFTGFGGTGKVRSLWLRLMHEEIKQLKQIEEIPIPADFHIVEITNQLGGTDYSSREQGDKEVVKNYWEHICHKHGYIPVEIDKPLWLLNKYWNPDGRQYINSQLEAIRS